MGFVVELEPGVWLVRPDVDPERTLVIENATRYQTERSARRQLSKVRKMTWGKFPGAEIYELEVGMPKELDRLEKIAAAMHDAEHKARKLREDDEHERTQAFNRALYEEMDRKYGESIVAAAHDRFAADAAVEAEKERLALAGHRSKYPIGTMLYEWDHGDRYGSGPRLTGKVGVWEPVTTTTVHAKGLEWSRAKVGDFVVRILDKKKLPSKRYLSHNFQMDRWLPEGQKPKW